MESKHGQKINEQRSFFPLGQQHVLGSNSVIARPTSLVSHPEKRQIAPRGYLWQRLVSQADSPEYEDLKANALFQFSQVSSFILLVGK